MVLWYTRYASTTGIALLLSSAADLDALATCLGNMNTICVFVDYGWMNDDLFFLLLPLVLLHDSFGIFVLLFTIVAALTHGLYYTSVTGTLIDYALGFALGLQLLIEKFER